MKNQILISSVLLFLFISACKKKDPEPVDYSPLKKSVVAQYGVVVYNTYLDAYKNALVFKEMVNEFVANPTEMGLENLKTFYGTKLRVPYNQTDAFRFYGGPIDNAVDGKEGEINSWPLDEGYIDYVTDAKDVRIDSGIVNSVSLMPVISKKSLSEFNDKVSETTSTTGYHAIEFLLWGQDLYQNSPGRRPYTDYVIGSGGTAKNQTRRGQYLKAVTELLVDDLQFTLNAWLPSANNYRATFENQNPDISLQLILTGLGRFTKGELFGERSLTFYNSLDQEDEHSCFSDLTTTDLQMGQQGIINVYYGKYTTTNGEVFDGTGLNELVAAINSDLNNATMADLENTRVETNAIPAPFDNNTKDINPIGWAQIKKAVDKGYVQADDFVKIAQALKLSLVL